MKRNKIGFSLGRILLIAALAVLLCAGCEKAALEPPAADAPKTAADTRVNKLVPDPNATGKLTIRYSGFVSDADSDYYNIAARLYKELYPNVDFQLEGVSAMSVEELDHYYTTLATELMAGSGPDVFEIISWGNVNPLKMMRAGAFADLTPYYDGDPNYNPGNYSAPAFRLGQLDGKQYLVPTFYTIPLLLTTQSILEETGFEVEKCGDYPSMLKEVARVLEENQLGCANESKIDSLRAPFLCPMYTGLELYDLDKKTISLDSPEFNEAFTLVKEGFMPYYSLRINTPEVGSLLAKRSMFIDTAGHLYFEALMQGLQLIVKYEEKPVMVPWRTFDGRIEGKASQMTAVSRNSENVENAYRYVKLLNSTEFLTQDNFNRDSLSVSVNEEYARLSIEEYQKATKLYYAENEPENGIVLDLEGLSDQVIDNYWEIVNEISTFRFESNEIAMIQEEMLPYLQGESSYEKAVAAAQNKLKIYIEE